MAEIKDPKAGGKLSDCIVRLGNIIPDSIVDLSTLALQMDQDGLATLQVSILIKDSEPISSASLAIKLNDHCFSGFIESDNPRRFEGTEYIEHPIVAKGRVLDSCTGGNLLLNTCVSTTVTSESK